MSCCFFSHLLLLLLPRSDRLSRRGTRHEVARRCEGWGGSSNFSLKVPPPPTDVWNLVAGYFWRWSPLYQSWAAAAVEPLASESERWVMLGEVEEQQRHQVASSEVAAPSVPLLSLRWTTVASSLSPVSKVMLICFSQPFGDCTWPASIPIPKNIVQVFWRITQDGAMNKWCHHDFGCLLNFQNGLHWYSALASVFAAPKSTLQQPLIQQIVHQWGLLPRRALKQIVNLSQRKKGKNPPRVARGSQPCWRAQTLQTRHFSGRPVPVGRAIDPPRDGWRWGTSESSPSGTEWTSHWRHEGDCDRCGLLDPVGVEPKRWNKKSCWIKVRRRCWEKNLPKDKKNALTWIVHTRLP